MHIIPIDSLTVDAVDNTLDDLFIQIFRVPEKVQQDMLKRILLEIIESSGKQIEAKVCEVIEQCIATFSDIYGLNIKLVNSPEGDSVHVTECGDSSASEKIYEDLKEDYEGADLPDGFFNVTVDLNDIFNTYDLTTLARYHESFIRSVIETLCVYIVQK